MAAESARILVVDDVADNRELLVRRLARLGLLRVDQAPDGVKALEAIRSHDYDLVLLDIMMPELDGFGVLAALSSQGVTNELPIIVISAMSEIDAVVRCIEMGAEDFLLKPFNPTLLRARVLASLEKKRLRDLTRAELRRKQTELAEARTLQLALVPAAFRGQLGGRRLAVDILLEPAREVGGDLVDYFPVGERLLVLLLGDVSDKGAAAALMMARTHALFRALAGRPDAVELFAEPARAVASVNAALAAGNAGCMFVTLLLATFDLVSGRFAYVRAGHVPPFRLTVAQGAAVVQRLPGEGNLPLGLQGDATYREASLLLGPDDRVLVVTDGFTEAQAPDGALFGEARIEALLTRAADPLGQIASAVLTFEAGESATDDKAAILLSLGASADVGAPFEVNLQATTDEISTFTGRLLNYLRDAGVDARASHHVALIVEELLINAGTHGGVANEPVHVRIGINADFVEGVVRDRGIAFDLRSAPEPALGEAAADRKVGGLGLFLVGKLAERITQRRQDGENCTTFAVKRPTVV